MRRLIFAASLTAIMGHGAIVIADEARNNEVSTDPATEDDRALELVAGGGSGGGRLPALSGFRAK